MTGEPHTSLEESFAELAAAVPAVIGLAVAAPGQPGASVVGRWSSGVAWSTIKVPLAIAALRRDRGRAKDLTVKAITESDNIAAEALWSQLGDPADAARQVQDVLREAGDTCTVVESRRLREGFTAFGQTQWPLDRQAQFAASLPGISDADRVIDLMHRLVDDHRWGLAAKGAAAKGGWGPGSEGDYLVRQFGIFPTASGHAGVALAAQAKAFEAGVDALNQMTAWLVGRVPELIRR
ncbi:hypothetical protein [Mycobacterium pseudokansasii]|uniref:Serine hydrolase n=1 Tax=Mycobacterium pseudokansasii TaxID=2341080 RepID=A0A498QYF8_9MYCO|nr:hypothetical protein [Mycobacterium pseudokansasii]KZS67132.1 hypothetical protein A4G27_10790 [Mycobacterium kansasii]VBA32200.1 hypothetical protein LAUMK35_05205 [Mycobacterium pseudokansasii]VBA33912.1 hypothetical protein LAUMK21_05163 [Mycobacterium pseudokansasii]VBA55528.1 hypothetical protein LAUMK142_05135 [Mycobacterium pseudokansasii]